MGRLDITPIVIIPIEAEIGAVKIYRIIQSYTYSKTVL